MAVLWGRRFRPYSSGVTESRWPWIFVSIIRQALGLAKRCPRDLGKGEGQSFLFLDLALLGLGFEEANYVLGYDQSEGYIVCATWELCVCQIHSRDSRWFDI